MVPTCSVAYREEACPYEEDCEYVGWRFKIRSWIIKMQTFVALLTSFIDSTLTFKQETSLTVTCSLNVLHQWLFMVVQVHGVEAIVNRFSSRCLSHLRLCIALFCLLAIM